ncbi:MAG TPA: N-acetylmuramoyl-L-alanine amidase, partial [Spirochaetota bacterium]|nr:N-acetylmuramoyl-L-alanine amidase [Spirochaetota bacterium]
MIKNFSAAIFFLLAPALILTAEELYDLKKSQSATINKIISNEKSESRKKELVDIINYIDTTYGELHEKLARGEKITIYFGPAHGKDHTGEWRGITTNRIGVTGLPEEYYSIKYSRKLYDLLKKNRFIEIAAKPEYRSVLEGKSDSYHYMKFRDVMRNARASNSFMVIEMHMNNVAIFNKADGLVNMPGIHMARDSNGRKMIVNIKSTNSGFLTLYNKFDASDFSRQYAVNIRQSLVKKGYIPNGWEYGAVADDRFTYYLNFPISLIYECGFISDPEEEKKLLDEDYMDGMIKSQYEMFLKTFNDMFGVDISGNELKITEKDYSDNIELLKLARIAIFYIQNAETDQANIAVRAMKKNYYHGANKGVIDYYSSIMNKINNSERHYHKGSRYNKRKKYSRARK